MSDSVLTPFLLQENSEFLHNYFLSLIDKLITFTYGFLEVIQNIIWSLT
ncbi:hypothetical protein N039_06350 [Staphylococcus sp. EGD-HP3]|nr:hypothetical protein N039_06350 [Staphylococcus sp. EGD-HP3]